VTGTGVVHLEREAQKSPARREEKLRYGFPFIGGPILKGGPSLDYFLDEEVWPGATDHGYEACSGGNRTGAKNDQK
jgi:hypothetical protein